MIVGAVKSEPNRPKSSQRGAINAWYLKVRENVDFYNQQYQKVQPVTQPNQEQQAMQTNQFQRMVIQSQGNSRSSSNIRQNISGSLKYIPHQHMNTQTSMKDQTSPLKQSLATNANIDEIPFPSPYQKSKRPPSQLMHILQNQKKNIRQLYALQLSGNMQSDEKHRNQMKDIKEKLIRVSQERNKKINSLIYEENRSNNNVQIQLNSNQVSQNNINNGMNAGQNIQKQNSLQDCRRSFECNDNKIKVFADYQNYLSNTNYTNNSSIQGINNINSHRVQHQQLQSQNSSTTLSQSLQTTQRNIVPNITSQSALNRVMKQSLNQIQHGITQSENLSQNIINIKRAQSRDQFSQAMQQNSQRMSSRTQSIICSQIIGPTHEIGLNQNVDLGIIRTNSICEDESSKIQQNKSNDRIREDIQFMTNTSLLNAFPLETEVTPLAKTCMSNRDEIFMDNTESRKIRQISNPSLRKKYKISSELLMKNFLKKDIQQQRQSYDNNEENSTLFKSNCKGISTDEPKREKRNKKHIKQMSVGDFNILRGISVDNHINNDLTPTPSCRSNISSNLSNFNDYYYNHQMISLVNRKQNLSASPIKRVHTQASQLPHNNLIESESSIKQLTTDNQIQANSPTEKLQNNNQNNRLKVSANITIKLANSRPSTSLTRINKDKIYNKLQSQNIQKQGVSPSGSIRSRPGTAAKYPNIAGIASQTSFNNQITYNNNNFNNYHNINSTSPSKSKGIVKQKSQFDENCFNFAELNSWDTSRAEENSGFELI